MNKKIKNYIDFLKKSRLTKEERVDLRKSFIISAGMSPTQDFIKSPFSRWDVLFMSRRTQLVLASFFILFLISGGVVLAANRALPGDLLYPIKTNINEKALRLVSSASPVAQAKFEVGLVNERLVEAEKLDSKNNLNQGNKKEVKQSLSNQTVRASEAVDRLNKSHNIIVESSSTSETKQINNDNNHGNRDFLDLSSSPEIKKVDNNKSGEGNTLEKVLEKHSDIIHKLERNN